MKQLDPSHVRLLNASIAVKDRLKVMAAKTADVETKSDLYALAGWLASAIKARTYRPSRPSEGTDGDAA